MITTAFLNLDGSIEPLLIPKSIMKGVSLFNPSITVYRGKLLVNIRNGNYTLWHSDEKNLIPHPNGPLVYLHPENDLKLKTDNIIAELDPVSLQIIPGSEGVIDMALSAKYPDPVWDFHGLEDVRLVVWNNILYAVGVRRDVKDNGEGRIELSQITYIDGKYVETERCRIPLPKGYAESYCEKNWMPVENIPYTFVKWTNPTELIRFDITSGTSFCTALINQNLELNADLRGSSQVIEIDEYYVAIVHETHLYKNELNQKDATYWHRFVIWNKDWSIHKVSKSRNFMGFKIEFCCGMVVHNDHVFITFSCQDNASFVMNLNLITFKNYLFNES